MSREWTITTGHGLCAVSERLVEPMTKASNSPRGRRPTTTMDADWLDSSSTVAAPPSVHRVRDDDVGVSGDPSGQGCGQHRPGISVPRVLGENRGIVGNTSFQHRGVPGVDGHHFGLPGRGFDKRESRSPRSCPLTRPPRQRSDRCRSRRGPGARRPPVPGSPQRSPKRPNPGSLGPGVLIPWPRPRSVPRPRTRRAEH